VHGLRVAALIALFAGSIGAGPAAVALECTFLAPPEAASAEIAAPDSDAVSGPRGRAGSEGPVLRPRTRGSAQGGSGTRPASTREALNPRLDVDGFTKALRDKLRRSTAGYAMQLRQNAAPLRTDAWSWAKRPGDGALAWDPDRRMHIASVSKLITAIALVKLLDDKGIDADAKIVGYLPAHWRKGPNIDQITFAQLLRHESGFDTDTYYADYRFMRRQVARGVTGVGEFAYQNLNFGLVRVLIPILNGDIAKDAALSEAAWDDQTLEGYARYVQKAVFAPSGVAGASLVRPDGAALAYRFPPRGEGWESGKLGCIAGAAGWFMSVNEVLDVLGTFRHHEKIVSRARAQALLASKFGIDRIETAGAAAFYVKNGWWRNKADGGLWMEQTVAYILPEGMELVVFTNSPVGRANEYLIDVVTGLYLRHVRYH
jgi:CubicO group peptidase (beta-lactamase class C family)